MSDSHVGACRLFLIMVLSGLLLSSDTTLAQELTPRAYWPSPVGVNVIVPSYSYNTGDVITDRALPVTGVDSKLHYLTIGYLRSISLLGRSAAIQANLPYVFGTTEGMLEGVPARRDLSGFADAHVRLAINVRGAPEMDVVSFQGLREAPRVIMGTSLQVLVPIGAYDPDRLLNEGGNRWGIKPAMGLIWPFLGTWMLEVEVGGWFFSDNDEFVGTTREQDPILSTQLHLVKRLRAGFWAALDGNFYTGGRTTVAGELRADLQRNSRIGATVAFPMSGGHAIKGSFSTGVATESGGDFEIFSFSYLYAWL